MMSNMKNEETPVTLATPATPATPGQESQQPKHFPVFVHKILIVLATIMWGSSFFIMKNAVDIIPPSWLVGIRFLACGIIMSLIFFPRMKRYCNSDHLAKGSILGILLFAGYWFQTVGLVYTTPGKNAFLTATYCVMIPFMMWVIAKKRPTIFNVVAGIMCSVGIGLVSLDGDLSIGTGEWLTLACAFMFGVHIVCVSKFSDGRDMMVLTAVQFLVAGLCAVVMGLCTETLPAVVEISTQLIIEVGYLIIFSSLIAFIIQNTALKYVPPTQASLLLSLESVFGVLFSVLFYREVVSIRLALGFVTIFLAITISEAGQVAFQKAKQKLEARKTRNVR